MKRQTQVLVAILMGVFVGLNTSRVDKSLRKFITNLFPSQMLSTAQSPPKPTMQIVSFIDSHSLTLGHHTTVKEIENSRKIQQEKPSRRKFIAYRSSAWEQQWLDHVDEWSLDYDKYVKLLMENQTDRVHDFMLAMCTDQLPQPHEDWCMHNDFVIPFYYNTKHRESYEWLSQRSPDARKFEGLTTKSLGPLQPGPEYAHIFSQFVYKDEVTGETFVEYIEPLVAGLRHPLARFHYAGVRGPGDVISFRGYILPPPPPRQPYKHAIYLDAGASEWATGDGGPSLSYFTAAWRRQGIDFDAIHAFEPTTKAATFMKSVPEEYKSRTHFRQTYIASSPETATMEQPFLPFEISQTLVPSTTDDRDSTYVFLKLDIDSPSVEDGTIMYLLEHNDVHVDEVAWEHHVANHPVMGKIWQRGPAPADMTLGQSMQLFLRLRQKGIRAHSWV